MSCFVRYALTANGNLREKIALAADCTETLPEPKNAHWLCGTRCWGGT